jgi:hypothetical protein
MVKMKIDEIIQLAGNENPKIFSNIPPKKAKAIARAVLTYIRKTIDQTPEGKIQIGGLGGFHVRQVERTIKGQNVTKKVVVFRAASPKKEDAI